jgi:hypothetical protein
VIAQPVIEPDYIKYATTAIKGNPYTWQLTHPGAWIVVIMGIHGPWTASNYNPAQLYDKTSCANRLEVSLGTVVVLLYLLFVFRLSYILFHYIYSWALTAHFPKKRGNMLCDNLDSKHGPQVLP